MLLVWSRQAADSAEVRREIDTALVCRVNVVPVLLDATDAAFHRATVLLRCAGINPLQSTDGGKHGA